MVRPGHQVHRPIVRTRRAVRTAKRVVPLSLGALVALVAVGLGPLGAAPAVATGTAGGSAAVGSQAVVAGPAAMATAGAPTVGKATAGVAVEPGTFTPVTPYRALDTRDAVGVGTRTPVPGGGTILVDVAGVGGLPADGVGAVSVTLTVTQPRAAGYLAAWASGETRPGTSNLNWLVGQTLANGAVVPVGADGRIALLNGSSASTHVIVDLTGWYAAGKPAVPGAYAPLPPTRVLDTRAGIGVTGTSPVRAGTTVRVAVARRGQPAAGAAAVVLNVTATQPTAAGYLALPGFDGTGAGSVLNWRARQTVANLVVAQVDPSGAVALQVGGPSGTTHLVADLVGFTVSGPLRDPGTLRARPLVRVVDTRLQQPVRAMSGLDVDINRGGFVVAAGGASAVAVNLTVTEGTAAGYLTSSAGGAAPPLASTLNWLAGQTVAATTVVPVSPTGTIHLYNGSTRSVHVIVDLEAVVLGVPVVDAPGWSTEQVPGTDGGVGTASGVLDSSCAEGPSCALLTSSVDARGQQAVALRRWDGSTWSDPQLTASDGLDQGAVGCSSSGLCVAAVSTGLRSQVADSTATQPWSLVEAPTDPDGRVGVARSVSCAVGGTTCMVVGSAHPEASSTPVPYAALRDGTGWHTLAVPGSASPGGLADVACRSDSSCVAVGLQSAGTTMPVLATWDGSTWSTQTLDVPGVTSSAVALSVAVGGGGYAVTGSYGSGSRFTATSSGAGWTASTDPAATYASGVLACQAFGSGCWADAPTGLDSVPDESPVVIDAASGAAPGPLSSLSCPTAWCVGTSSTSLGAVTDRGVVIDQTGGSWSAGLAPTPDDSVEGSLNPGTSPDRVSCWYDGCLLVGPYAARSGGQPLKADVLVRSPCVTTCLAGAAGSPRG